MRYFLTVSFLLFSTSAYAADVVPLSGTMKQPESLVAPTPPPKLIAVRPDHHKPDEKPDGKPDGEHRHHRRTYVPVYTNIIVSTPVQSLTSEITNKVSGDEYVINDNRIIFTNLWRGSCHQSDCTVSAGYMAGNPLAGVVVMTQPSLNTAPLLIPAPTANGPVRITRADVVTGILTLEALSGRYQLQDVQGNVVQDGSWPKTIDTPGRATYIFDINKAKFNP